MECVYGRVFQQYPRLYQPSIRLEVDHQRSKAKSGGIRPLLAEVNSRL